MKILSFFSAMIIAVTVFSINTQATDFSDVSAKGAILIDALTGEVLFEKNAYGKLPMASTTKIMSALLALESGNLDERFVVDKDAIRVEGSSMGLLEGDTVTMRTLAYGMLLPSGNDAANSAAVRISGSVDNFVQLMNERALEMGLNSTHFITPSGLDDNTDEHYSTASDMAMLTREALKNEDFRKICCTKNAKLEYGNPPYQRWLTNTNKLLTLCEGCIGVKTGFTDKAKRCLVSACERNGATLICVTLNDPNDWIDHSRLYDYGFSMMSKQKLPIEYKTFNVAAVGGVSDVVHCKTDRVTLNMLNGKAKEVESKVFIQPFVYCPIAEKANVGRVEYYYKGEKIAEKPIYVVESVGRQSIEVTEQGFFSNYWNRFKALFQ